LPFKKEGRFQALFSPPFLKGDLGGLKIRLFKDKALEKHYEPQTNELKVSFRCCGVAFKNRNIVITMNNNTTPITREPIFKLPCYQPIWL